MRRMCSCGTVVRLYRPVRRRLPPGNRLCPGWLACRAVTDAFSGTARSATSPTRTISGMSRLRKSSTWTATGFSMPCSGFQVCPGPASLTTNCAISLRDARLIWSVRLDFKNPGNSSPQFAVADLDGDGRHEVVTTEQPAVGADQAFVLKALEGHDGTVRWTWNGGNSEDSRIQVYGWLALANFEGDGRRTVCLRFLDRDGRLFVLVLDKTGHERARRELSPEAGNLGVADVDGDGRDELLIAYDDRLHVWRADLTELWASPHKGYPPGHVQVLPNSPGHAGTVIVGSAVGLEGATGVPRWTGDSAPPGGQFTNTLLDRGDAAGAPSILTFGMGISVTRAALPTTPTGAYVAASGTPVRPGLARDDPRWTRPLPWAHAIDLYVAPWGVFAVIALALFNVLLPFSILRLVAFRRPWTLRLMLALPVAAAIPLTAVVVFEPMIPVLPDPFPSSSRALYALGSLAGIPIVSLAAFAGWCLLRRRWQNLGLIAGLAVLMSVAIGLVWLRIDMQAMPAIER